jgi:hypothetical protein
MGWNFVLSHQRKGHTVPHFGLPVSTHLNSFVSITPAEQVANTHNAQ